MNRRRRSEGDIILRRVALVFIGVYPFLFFKLKLYTLAKPRQHAYCTLTAIKWQKVRERGNLLRIYQGLGLTAISRL